MPMLWQLNHFFTNLDFHNITEFFGKFFVSLIEINSKMALSRNFQEIANLYFYLFGRNPEILKCFAEIIHIIVNIQVDNMIQNFQAFFFAIYQQDHFFLLWLLLYEGVVDVFWSSQQGF